MFECLLSPIVYCRVTVISPPIRYCTPLCTHASLVFISRLCVKEIYHPVRGILNICFPEFAFLVSRTQIIALAPLSNSYLVTSSQTLREAYLVSTEHVIILSNVFSNIALLLLGISSIIIGLVMLKGVFSEKVGYLTVISGTLTILGALGVLFEPIAVLVLFGLTLGAVWQIIAGIKLYKLG